MIRAIRAARQLSERVTALQAGIGRAILAVHDETKKVSDRFDSRQEGRAAMAWWRDWVKALSALEASQRKALAAVSLLAAELTGLSVWLGNAILTRNQQRREGILTAEERIRLDREVIGDDSPTVQHPLDRRGMQSELRRAAKAMRLDPIGMRDRYEQARHGPGGRPNQWAQTLVEASVTLEHPGLLALPSSLRTLADTARAAIQALEDLEHTAQDRAILRTHQNARLTSGKVSTENH